MKRKHEMPFGAACGSSGGVRFRLWAPAAKRVAVVLGGSRTLELVRLAEGWFELQAADARAGSTYKFLIDGKTEVPDPASRFQPSDMSGPSLVVDPSAFEWADGDWKGRRWEEVVLYELHVGTFTPEGKYSAIENRLDYLKRLGVTAIELMPLSDFAGSRNWGYDGVLPYAPDSSYGTPEDLKRLIASAHEKNLMVFLDVVYNHFGPEGNYLHAYAPQFFTGRHHTPWGAAINFDGRDSRAVRDYFIHNALYWLEEYHFDGLRFDAVHAIRDDSRPGILTELARTVRSHFGPERHLHLVLENDDNAAHYLRRDEQGRAKLYNAQWNDDIHHASHSLITGEADGYYSDYAAAPLHHLGRCLAEGFSYQGEPSPYRDGAARGEPSRGLPPTAFVSFLQNHDQVGNRALGDRIGALATPEAVRSMMAILLLAPAPPLLFMGEEFAAATPFLFFCDFRGKLATAVTEGRRGEFAKFKKFSDPAARQAIPDPNDERTFHRSKLDWSSLSQPQHRDWLDFYRHLLDLRQRRIVPLLSKCRGEARFSARNHAILEVDWKLASSAQLSLRANLASQPGSIQAPARGQLIYSTLARASRLPDHPLPPWSVAWYLDA